MQRPAVDTLNSLKGDEAFLLDDAFLVPIIQNDPLLRAQLLLMHQIHLADISCRDSTR